MTKDKDIVERLRDWGNTLSFLGPMHGDHPAVSDLCDEAADEIERLRAALLDRSARVSRVERVSLYVTDSWDTTERGTGGFGSTGTNSLDAA